MKKVKTFMSMIILIILINAPVMAESPPAVPPMPPEFQNIKIIKPDPIVSTEINQLLGEWEGVWIVIPPGGVISMPVRRAKLIVYEVTPTKVKYLWGVGFNPVTKAEAKWTKYESEFRERGGKKIFGHTGPSGYSMENTTMELFFKEGVIEGKIGRASIEMQKLK
jgi:hypothetical protein